MMMTWHEDLERVVPGQEGRADEEAGEVVLAQAQGLEDLGKDGLLARRRQRQVDPVQRLLWSIRAKMSAQPAKTMSGEERSWLRTIQSISCSQRSHCHHADE
jgi:hypothetical protein